MEMVLQMCWGQGDALTDVLGSRRWTYRCVGVKEMALQMCWGQGDGLTDVLESRRWSYTGVVVKEMVLQTCWGQWDSLTDVLGSGRWSYGGVGVKEMVLHMCWGQGDGHIHIQARQFQWDHDDYNTGHQASCHCTVKSQDKHRNPTSAQLGSNKAWFNQKKYSHHQTGLNLTQGNKSVCLRENTVVAWQHVQGLEMGSCLKSVWCPTHSPSTCAGWSLVRWTCSSQLSPSTAFGSLAIATRLQHGCMCLKRAPSTTQQRPKKMPQKCSTCSRAGLRTTVPKRNSLLFETWAPAASRLWIIGSAWALRLSHSVVSVLPHSEELGSCHFSHHNNRSAEPVLGAIWKHRFLSLCPCKWSQDRVTIGTLHFGQD